MEALEEAARQKILEFFTTSGLNNDIDDIPNEETLRLARIGVI